jgi:hypothetical protein
MATDKEVLIEILDYEYEGFKYWFEDIKKSLNDKDINSFEIKEKLKEDLHWLKISMEIFKHSVYLNFGLHSKMGKKYTALYNKIITQYDKYNKS